MATKSIAWNTGSGNISVDYGGSKDGMIIVTSDNNNLYESRSQQITVKTTDGSNIERTVTIQQEARVRVDISSAVVTAADQTYSGSAMTPAPTVTLNGDTVPSTGYDVAYSDNTNAGTAIVTVTGKGEYTGTASGSFSISKVTPTVVAPTAKVLTYNGGAQELVNAGSTDFGTLKYSLDNSTWSTSIPTGTDYGKYSVYYKVEGDSNINDVSAVRVRCTINEKQVTATVELSQSSYTYSGSACTPGVTVKDGSTVIPASEYTVTYSNNVNAGTATVTITDNMGGNYDVIGSATFTIAKASISPYIIISGWTYGGTASDPSVSGNPGEGEVSYSYKASSAPDTSYSETKPTNAGDYVVRAIVAETSNYYGATVTNTFAIAKADPGYTAPTAKSLIYNGDYQDLLYAGSTSDGTIQYSTDGSTWGTSIPTGVGATTYTTYWRIIGDGNHNDKAAAGIETTIAKVTPSVTAPTAKSLTYTGSAQTLANAGSTNWGTLQYSLDNSSWGTSVPSGTSATGYTVYYRVVGNANVNDVAASYISCSIAKASPSYTAPVASSLTYNGDAQYLVTTGSTSDGTIQYSSNGSDWSTTRPSQTNAGTYTTYWRLVGDANHTDVGSASISTTIGKASGSVGTAPTAKGLTYTGSAQALANAGSGTGTMYYKLGTSGDYSTSMPSATNAGSWTLYYYAAESANYTQSEVGSISVGIAKAAGSVSVSGVSLTYNGNARDLAAVSGNTGTMHYSTDYSNWSTSIPTGTNASSYTIYWYMDASTNYEGIGASASRYVSSSIAKADQAAPTAYGATTTYPNTATASASGGGGVGSIEWESAQSQGSVGSHTTRARWSGNSNYNASPWSDYVTVQMNKAAGSVNISGVSLTYNGEYRNLATVYDPTGTIHFSTDYHNWSTTIPTGINADSYVVYWYLDASTNYEGIDASTSRYVSSSIAKADQSAPTAYGATTTYPTTATASASGGGGVGSIEWSNGNTQTSIGSKTTYARWSGNNNYNPSAWSNGVTLAMNKAAGSVSISGRSLSYNGGSQSLVSVSGATGTMHYSTDYSNWSTDIPAATNAGSWTIYWYMDASNNYEGISASTSRYVSSSIAKINPTITAYPTNVNPTYNGSAQYLLTGGTANVGGSFSYSTGTNAGSYTATWWFTPNDTTNYNSLSGYVDATIAKASRTLSFADSYVVLNTSSNVTKTATPSAGSGDGAITYSISSTTYATIDSSTGAVTSKTSDGSATVTATIAEGTNYLSATASYNLYVFATTHNYDYNGSYRSVTLPPGTYQFQCWGAQGGSNAAASSYGITAQAGGKGGYSVGQLTVAQETSARVYVGGQGSSSAGGFNGGGSTSGASSYSTGTSGQDGYHFGISEMGGGGGASDIRLSDGNLLSRMIVAGGGSGGSMCYQKKTTSTSKTVTFDSGSIVPKKIEGSITPTSGPFTENGNTFYQGVVRDLPFSSGNQYEVNCSGDLYDVFFTKNNGSQNIGRYTGVITGSVSDIWLIVRSRTQTQINYSFRESTYGTHQIDNGYYYSISAYQLVVRNFAFKAGHTYTLSVSGSGISEYFISLNGNTNEGHSISLNSDNNNYLIVMRTTSTSTVSWTITDTYTETQTTETTDYQVGFVGGGTTGGGYNSNYQGRQNAAGTGGSFGQGANQTASGYRYCSGAGGGGWYGGGGGQTSDSSMTYCKYSGGGSGFVNTAASAGNRPSGYTGLQLDSGSTTAGDSSFPAPSGGNETGHSGNGYARITRL